MGLGLGFGCHPCYSNFKDGGEAMECQRRDLTPAVVYRLMVARSKMLWGELAIPGILGPFRLPQTIGMGFISGAFWIGLVGTP